MSNQAKLTVDEAMALAQMRRGQWLLAGQSFRDNRWCPTYQCGNCQDAFMTIVTHEAKLPAACWKCGASLVVPS
jgi:predicted SprT family Zn-dependent metalloprotease